MTRAIIFGTAGHVDHGKSALVRALTGTDPDRLAEEKAREMTIDLGFAFLSLPGVAQPVAIVDVPGHEMFLRNMVAGATGIEAAIFVVAADEGVMPQTREHLQVLCQLQVGAGVVALTKSDRAAPGRIAGVSSAVRKLVAGTFLERARLIPVSALTGDGLAELRAELSRLAREAPARPAEGPFRLPVDRAFTIKGAGTVVTGTASSGRLQVGERVICLPGDELLRVRGLQVHNQPVAEVGAGQRAAINLAGVEKEALARGRVLATPGAFAPSPMLDVRLALAADAPRPLLPRTRVRVHHGTAEVMARVVLLEGEALAAGDSGLAQLRLESPLVAAAGDRFVLRSYSPMQVIGGGLVVDAHPPKRRPAAGAADVAARERVDADGAVLQLLARAGESGLPESELLVGCGLSAEGLRAALARLGQEESVIAGRRGCWFAAEAVSRLAAALVAALADRHRAHPIRPTVPLRDVLATAAGRPDQREAARLALEALTTRGRVLTSPGGGLRLAEHQVRWPARESELRDRLLAGLRREGLAAPSFAEIARELRAPEANVREVLDALLEMGAVIAVSADLFLDPQAFAEARARVIAFLHERRQLSIGDARTLLGVSRKYLLPFLERLDRDGVTVRQGDGRVMARGEPP